MAQQTVDTDALRSLSEALNNMIGYSDALRAGASAFAYMLPAEWQGPAFTRFLAAFEMWSASASALTEETAQLQAHTAAVLQAYETGLNEMTTGWTQLQSEMGA